jgi:hypothetical protein
LAAPPELERAPGSVVGLVRILYQNRIIGFSLAAGVAALALTALYYAAPHEHSSTVSVGGALESHSPKPTEAPRSSVPVVGESGLASATGRPRSTPAGGAGVSVLQISVLSGSASQQHVDAVISLQASTRSPVTVQISYWGQSGNDRTGQSWYSTVVSGALSYQVPIGIPTGAYCGDVVTVTASAGGQYAAQNTSPGC